MVKCQEALRTRKKNQLKYGHFQTVYHQHQHIIWTATKGLLL